jgi:hypothetical protein
MKKEKEKNENERETEREREMQIADCIWGIEIPAISKKLFIHNFLNLHRSFQITAFNNTLH